MEPCLPWGRISTTCAIYVSRNDIENKYIFTVSQKNSARQVLHCTYLVCCRIWCRSCGAWGITQVTVVASTCRYQPVEASSTLTSCSFMILQLTDWGPNKMADLLEITCFIERNFWCFASNFTEVCAINFCTSHDSCIVLALPKFVRIN